MIFATACLKVTSLIMHFQVSQERRGLDIGRNKPMLLPSRGPQASAARNGEAIRSYHSYGGLSSGCALPPHGGQLGMWPGLSYEYCVSVRVASREKARPTRWLRSEPAQPFREMWRVPYQDAGVRASELCGSKCFTLLW